MSATSLFADEDMAVSYPEWKEILTLAPLAETKRATFGSALQRPLPKVGFQRALPCRRVPALLTRDESDRLLRHLDSTTRLMAELAYGVGLRLVEVFRLRVRHVDLRSLQVHVLAEESGKHRAMALPKDLSEILAAHLQRLHRLYLLDRAARLPGVWLPRALAEKECDAGATFEWQWLFPSRELAVDPATGARRRHHVGDSLFLRAVKQAAAQARITKRITPRLVRQSFATHLRAARGETPGWTGYSIAKT